MDHKLVPQKFVSTSLYMPTTNGTRTTPVFTTPIPVPPTSLQGTTHVTNPVTDARIIPATNLSMITEVTDEPDLDLNDMNDTQFAQEWLKMRGNQTKYNQSHEQPYCEDILDEALFDKSTGKYYMRELGLWDHTFNNVLIYHELTGTTFTYQKEK